MKKGLIAAAVIVAVGLVVKRRVSCGGVDFERLVEGMPEGAPPKWMFHNIKAIRENTERTVELLEREPTPGAGPEGAPRADDRT